jgi:predicted kinase
VVVGGAPATGKTTVARAIVRATGWHLLRSDEVRKELAGLAPLNDARAPLDAGLYSRERTADTYAALLSRARAQLAHGVSVVIDASWPTAASRDAARLAAGETSSDLVAIRCTADARTTAERATLRRAARSDASDADPDIAAALAARFEPWPGAVTLDTTGTDPRVVAAHALTVVGTS